MLISQAFPRRFANAADIGDQTPTLRIARVTQEKVGPASKPVIWFFGAHKGIILSATLARQIAELHGDDTALWTGQPVTLHTIRVKVNGEPALSIRARAPASAASQAPQPAPLRNPSTKVATA